MLLTPLVVLAFAAPPPAPPPDRRVEKQPVVSITSEQIKGGILTQITWDGGLLLLQGVFVDASGELKADYFLVPADGIEVERRAEPTNASIKYWELKSNRLGPTGLGRIESGSDTKMPMYGVAGLDQRVRDAFDMGGMQTKHVLRLGSLVMLERTSDVAPYDGETYSWSPPELNRIAYVDGKGDLWVARADGARARRVLRGNFMLPAWSEDGRSIAIVERTENGRRWEVSLILLPEELRTPPGGR
jgi:hypothetical protein